MTRKLVSLLALVLLLASVSLPGTAAEESPADAARSLDGAIAEAEAFLRDGELQAAESRYRDALLEAWLLLGGLEAGDGRLAEAREAFRRASASAVETRRALQSLALVQLQLGEAPQAVAILTRLVGKGGGDREVRRLLAQALVAAGRVEEAVQELEEARSAARDDLEVAFTLASGYLRLKRTDAAARLFEEVAKGRPIPQTRVLIGRTYRDFGEYDRARAELRAALKQDPRVRRAHYYLGMVAVLERSTAGLEEAIAEFEAELKLAPADPVVELRLGMALVEAQRQAQALPHLERVARSEPPPADAFHYLGRCQLALERPSEAVASLRRALELGSGPAADEARVGSIHYLLGLALRKLGAADEAASHFGEAEAVSTRRAQDARDYLARYLADTPNTQAVVAALPSLVELSPLASLAPPQRTELRRRATAAIARAHLNLGVMHAQAERFARAAEELEKAAAADPDFPQVQYSLGVARFNALQFDKSAEPLARALAASPSDAGVKRMLALAWFNSEAYDKAAELLHADPGRETDPSLQYAYGAALVRSGRAAEAEPVFAGLVARHGDSAQLNTLLGQAHAQQGDWESAIQALTRALQQDPAVAEANATLGVIYLRQGRLGEAEQALRAELAHHPGDFQSQHHLATVLELQDRLEEALPLLRSVLKAKPQHADARYLLGKILLARGAAAEALQHLEAALRLTPEAANVHYQLGQVYQKLGRPEEAERHFELFRRLKDKRRGGA